MSLRGCSQASRSCGRARKCRQCRINLGQTLRFSKHVFFSKANGYRKVSRWSRFDGALTGRVPKNKEQIKERASVDLGIRNVPGSEAAQIAPVRKEKLDEKGWFYKTGRTRGGGSKGRNGKRRGEVGEEHRYRGRRGVDVRMSGGNYESRLKKRKRSGCRVTPERGRCGC